MIHSMRLEPGVAPGIFRRGADSSETKGLKYDFQGIINAKNLRKIAFHFLTGASMLRRGGP